MFRRCSILAGGGARVWETRDRARVGPGPFAAPPCAPVHVPLCPLPGWAQDDGEGFSSGCGLPVALAAWDIVTTGSYTANGLVYRQRASIDGIQMVRYIRDIVTTGSCTANGR